MLLLQLLASCRSAAPMCSIRVLGEQTQLLFHAVLSPAWGLTTQLIFTLLFVLLFHCYTASKFFVQVGITSRAGSFVEFLSLKSLKLVVLITCLVKLVPKHLAKWKLWHGDHHKILLAADKSLNTSTACLTFGQFLY